MDATEALDRLKAGNERFQRGRLEGAGTVYRRREETREAQDPFAIVLGCSDSRVPTEMIFDTGLGDLFVIRVAGNVANMSSIASAEYAVAQLGTKLIVVMAHESCGAVTAAVAGDKASEKLEILLGHIEPALQSAVTGVDDVARQNARNSADRLIDESDIIGPAVKRGDVVVVTAFYRFSDGAVEFDGIKTR